MSPPVPPTATNMQCTCMPTLMVLMTKIAVEQMGGHGNGGGRPPMGGSGSGGSRPPYGSGSGRPPMGGSGSGRPPMGGSGNRPPPSGRAAKPQLLKETFNHLVVVGKKSYECLFSMVYTVDRVDPRKSRAKCKGIKKGAVKQVTVTSPNGFSFTMDMKFSAKGVAMAKITVEASSSSSGSGGPSITGGSGRPPTGGSGSGRPPTGGSGSGSGGPSTGGIWDDMCFCVDEDVCNLPMPGGMGGGPQGSGRPPVGGSGSGRPPPGGSGSGRPPVGGSGSGGSGSGPVGGSGSGNNTGGSATTAPGGDDEVVTRVKSYIDSGTCARVSSSSSCGDSAESYFREFVYQGKRIVVSNQVPNHPHEHDQVFTNPNEACERYQYISLPLQPAKGSSKQRTGLGSIGTAVTGAAFFNDWSDPNGKVAMSFEARSLDSCFGHSAREGSYHYHANINCTDAGSATGAVDPDRCKMIGFYRDGVPVYGLCKDVSGMVMSSCYTCTGSCTSSVTHVSGTYTGLGANSDDYTYDQAAFNAGTCNLDEANGAVHPTTGEYSYFMTTTYPWTPIYYFGEEGINRYCSAA